MILESEGFASRIFGPDRTGFTPKLDLGHGFDVPTATIAPPISKLLIRLTEYGNQRN